MPVAVYVDIAKHLEQRKDMMQKWADYLDVLKLQAKGGNVIAGTFNKHA
ncbi:MAG: hypothetical protein U5M23_02390 [Marinagarivorans sp.]|nr:hypothetical protein [Marinagarivorans sp.]